MKVGYGFANNGGGSSFAIILRESLDVMLATAENQVYSQIAGGTLI